MSTMAQFMEIVDKKDIIDSTHYKSHTMPITKVCISELDTELDTDKIYNLMKEGYLRKGGEPGFTNFKVRLKRNDLFGLYHFYLRNNVTNFMFYQYIIDGLEAINKGKAVFYSATQKRIRK